MSVTHACDQRGGRWSLERLTLKHPRAIRQGMGGFDVASLDREPERSRTDPEEASGFVQIHPAFRCASIPIVTSDVVVSTERDHPFSSPAIPTPGEEPIPVQDIGQQIVRTNPRQHADRIDGVLRRVRGVLPASSSRQSQFRMHAAFPVNDQHDFGGVGRDIHDDFLNECPDEAFLQSDICVGIRPDGLEIRGQGFKRFSSGDHDVTATVHVLVDAVFDLVDTLQRLIPASFQFIRHEAIVRISRVVLFVRSASRVSRGFQLARPRVQDLVLLMGRRVTRHDRGLDRSGLHHPEQFLGDGVVDH
jgi:hypothetical protein